MNKTKTIVLCHSGSSLCESAAPILERIGYSVISCYDATKCKTLNPDVLVVDSSCGEIDSFYAYASPITKVITLEYGANDSGLMGFIDLTEHLLRGFNVKLPELIMLINDILHPKPSGITRKPRVPGGFSCLVEFNNTSIEGYVFNISEDGAFVELPDPPERNTDILITFQMPNSLKLKGKVVWRVLPEESKKYHSPPGAGVNFILKSTQEREFLLRLVDNKGRVNEET